MFVIGTLGMGGAESQLVTLANLLEQEGIEVHIGVLNLGIPEKKFRFNEGIQIHDFKLRFFKSPLYSFLELPTLIRLVRRSNFDAIYSFMPEAIMISFPIVKLFSRTTIRIAGIRGSLIRRGYLLQHVFYRLLRNSDFIIFNSSYLAEKFSSELRLNSEKVRIIHNGVENSLEQSRVEICPPTGIVISNFHPYKGYRTLISAISKVGDTCYFYFVGDGAEQIAMEELVYELKLTSRVKFLGKVDPRPYIALSQFAVHPSVSEGLSNAILEEISAGLPIIASDIPENYPLVRNGKNGLLVNPNSSEAFAQAISELISAPDKRIRMGIESHRISQDFTWGKCLSEHLELFQEFS